MLHVRHAKLDFGAALKAGLEAESEHALSVLLVAFATGLPSIRHAESIHLFIKSFSSRAAGLQAFVLCICSCFCVYCIPALLSPIPCSFAIPLLHTNVAAVVAELTEPVSLS